MFVWMAKFGAAYGVRTGIHVGVDVLINQLSPKVRNKFIFFGLFAGAVFTAIVGTFGASFVWQLAHTDSTSPDMEAPDVDRLSGDSMRVLSDVVPLFAGGLDILEDGRTAQARPCARRRRR